MKTLLHNLLSAAYAAPLVFAVLGMPYLAAVFAGVIIIKLWLESLFTGRSFEDWLGAPNEMEERE